MAMTQEPIKIAATYHQKGLNFREYPHKIWSYMVRYLHFRIFATYHIYIRPIYIYIYIRPTFQGISPQFSPGHCATQLRPGALDGQSLVPSKVAIVLYGLPRGISNHGDLSSDSYSDSYSDL